MNIASQYHPVELADSILALLEHMECASNAKPEYDTFRTRTGLLCTPEFRNPSGNRGVVENAITGWLAEFFPHATSQKAHKQSGRIPDIIFTYAAEDSEGQQLLVYLEAKPVWKSWLTTGEIEYEGITPDNLGRCSTNSHIKNVDQVVSDRDKLLDTYTHPNDRRLLLALVFQRPEELDEQLINAVGPGWSYRKRHILDRCNPPGDDIGMTGMVFWPSAES